MRRVRAVLGAVGLAVGLWFASPAVAAFPGANGLLAVQPASGGGIVLVAPSGRGAVRRICTDRSRCGTPRLPRWSPDGRAIVFAGPAIRIVFTDGSCLNCRFGVAGAPAFESDGSVISFIQRGRITLDGIDGLRRPRAAGAAAGVAAATDAVWSPGGKLAVVSGGALWAGRPGRLMRLAVASQPSWSPSGDAIAAAAGGWVVIIRVRDHRVVRLAPGSAPAFSPDGRSIAFVAPDRRLMIIPTRGTHSRARPVGDVRAVSVDWQPRPRGPNPGCVAPPGSTVTASTADAVVTEDGRLPFPGFGKGPPIAYMGCLRANGRERLLERFQFENYDAATWIRSAVLAAPYAALVEHSEDEHYGGSQDVVRVFDLRTGQQGRAPGGEGSVCPDPVLGPRLCTSVAQVVLGRDGVSAAHISGVAAPSASTPAPLYSDPCTAGGPCTFESIQTSDKTGLHTVDSAETPGTGDVLTGLALNGDVLSWSHGGNPRAVALTPP